MSIPKGTNTAIDLPLKQPQLSAIIDEAPAMRPKSLLNKLPGIRIKGTVRVDLDKGEMNGQVVFAHCA